MILILECIVCCFILLVPCVVVINCGVKPTRLRVG